MKPFLPLLTVGLFLLSACGLEKPPASLKFPDDKKAAAAPEAAAPAPVAPAATEAPADPKLAAGKAVYDANCAGCHEAGMMGAPKPGDKAAWSARIPQGLEVITKKSLEGFQGKAGMMPAKGGNASLTNEQVSSAVAFMVDKSK
ncbi:MAG: cytochrome c5 family protein [Chlorobium sp.]|nr:MAG: cytochrome c5 family protein [Chlorobium sp.]